MCTATVYGQDALSDILFDLENHKSLQNGICGFSLIDLENQEEVASLNAETSLIPASSLKLLTSLTSLDVLGEDFQYTTTIAYDGEISSDGTLNGNIYIIGSGDPTLGTNRIKGSMSFSKLISFITEKIKTLGITCIDGKIIADESIFDSFPICPSWQWNDLGNYYACGSWGINVNENLYKIYFSNREKVGVVPRIRTHSPYIHGIQFSNEVVTDRPKTPDNAYIFGGPYEYFKRIVGTIPSGKGDFVIKGSIPDPPLFLSYHISESLSKNGIENDGYKTQFKKLKKQKKRTEIAKISSPKLLEIIKRVNFHSINLYSESLLKTLGSELKKSGSGQTGIREVKNYIRKKKLNVNSLYMEDGSGLSARNLISAKLLAQLLAHYAGTMDQEMVLSLLPQAGKEGTMRSMFRNSQAKNKIWAKSGSMERVQSFSGFIKGSSGKFYAFSIICNNFTIKNRDMRKIIEYYLNRIYKAI